MRTRDQLDILKGLHALNDDEEMQMAPDMLAQEVVGWMVTYERSADLADRLIANGWATWAPGFFSTSDPDLQMTKAGMLVLMDRGAPKENWWVSVGGAPCEPAVFCKEGIFTFGCPDAHDHDHIDFVQRMNEPPDTPTEAISRQEAFDRARARDAKRGIHHGYRVFA